jgi:hypothetical protein
VTRRASFARNAAADMADTLAQIATSRAAEHAETRARPKLTLADVVRIPLGRVLGVRG